MSCSAIVVATVPPTWLSSYFGCRRCPNHDFPLTELVPFAIIVDFESLTSGRTFFLLGAEATPRGANASRPFNS